MRKLNLCSESGFATSSRIPWPPMFPPVSASLLAMKQLVSVSMAAAALIFFSRTNEQTHPRRQRHDSRTDGRTMTLATTTRKSFLASFSHDLGVGTVAARASEQANVAEKGVGRILRTELHGACAAGWQWPQKHKSYDLLRRAASSQDRGRTCAVCAVSGVMSCYDKCASWQTSPLVRSVG